MELHEARWWNTAENGQIQCELCPRRCCIPQGKTGYCGVRVNQQGKLYSMSYGRPVAVAIDPIEKKPLSEFMPGTRTFSFGTFGCNLGCVFCQNHTLSRGKYDRESQETFVSPGQLVEAALRSGCPSISYTYNEPGVFAEYILEVAVLAHEKGLKNILVSNGYISEQVAEELYPLMDAANTDMKGFSEEYYRQMCQAELAPVLENLQLLYRLGVHLEITTLIVPGKNDGDEEVRNWLTWVRRNLTAEIPLHFSAYHPAYHCHISATLPDTLYHIRELAVQEGFKHVYLGNI